jgi:hypothetical protein
VLVDWKAVSLVLFQEILFHRCLIQQYFPMYSFLLNHSVHDSLSLSECQRCFASTMNDVLDNRKNLASHCLKEHVFTISQNWYARSARSICSGNDFRCEPPRFHDHVNARVHVRVDGHAHAPVGARRIQSQRPKYLGMGHHRHHPNTTACTMLPGPISFPDPLANSHSMPR